MNCIVVPAQELSVLYHLARFGHHFARRSYSASDRAVYGRFVSHLRSPRTREVADALRKLFEGKEVPDGDARQTALGLIAAVFTSHAWSHRDAGSFPSSDGATVFNYPAALHAALRCRCGDVPQYRRILSRYGMLHRIL